MAIRQLHVPAHVLTCMNARDETLCNVTSGDSKEKGVPWRNEKAAHTKTVLTRHSQKATIGPVICQGPVPGLTAHPWKTGNFKDLVINGFLDT